MINSILWKELHHRGPKFFTEVDTQKLPIITQLFQQMCPSNKEFVLNSKNLSCYFFVLNHLKFTIILFFFTGQATTIIFIGTFNKVPGSNKFGEISMYPFMAKYLSLDLRNVMDAGGNIDEGPSKVLISAELSVFNEANPLPKNAVKGDEEVMKLLQN